MDKIEPNNVVKIDFRKTTTDTQKNFREKDLNEKKRSLFQEWLQKGVVCLLLDARKPGVKVPEEFASAGDLRLNFSHGFFIPDFNFNESAVWATLSFSAGEFFCSVPWQSVYGMESAVLGKGAVWFESFPGDYDKKKVFGFDETMLIRDSETEKSLPENLENVVTIDFSR